MLDHSLSLSEDAVENKAYYSKHYSNRGKEVICNSQCQMEGVDNLLRSANWGDSVWKSGTQELC